MDARTCLMTRRSVRKYKPDAVPTQVLQEIMEAAVCAPSGMDLQPWYFVVVQSPEALQDLKGIISRAADAFVPTLKQRFPNNPETVQTTTGFMRTLGNAPVCVLAFMLKDYPEKTRRSALLSVANATENLLLAAWEKGVASCWVSAPYALGFGPELQERFAPGKGEFVALVTMGWPDQRPSMPKRKDDRYTFI